METLIFAAVVVGLWVYNEYFGKIMDSNLAEKIAKPFERLGTALFPPASEKD